MPPDLSQNLFDATLMRVVGQQDVAGFEKQAFQ